MPPPTFITATATTATIAAAAPTATAATTAALTATSTTTTAQHLHHRYNHRRPHCRRPRPRSVCSPASLPTKPQLLVGASTAYHLALRGIKSVVVERAAVAAAASGKAGGFLAGGWGSGPTVRMHEVGFAMHEELAETLGVTSYRKIPTLQVGPFCFVAVVVVVAIVVVIIVVVVRVENPPQLALRAPNTSRHFAIGASDICLVSEYRMCSVLAL